MLDQIKKLREQTDVSVMQCKKALEEAGGDFDKALELLREEGAKIAEKKSEREMKAGIVDAYIHSNKQIGAMVEVLCETDFVARNKDFQEFVHNIAMHIAAMNPSNKEELLEQAYIKNPNITIADYIKEAVQKFGENINISRFEVFNL